MRPDIWFTLELYSSHGLGSSFKSLLLRRPSLLLNCSTCSRPFRSSLYSLGEFQHQLIELQALQRYPCRDHLYSSSGKCECAAFCFQYCMKTGKNKTKFRIQLIKIKLLNFISPGLQCWCKCVSVVLLSTLRIV